MICDVHAHYTPARVMICDVHAHYTPARVRMSGSHQNSLLEGDGLEPSVPLHGDEPRQPTPSPEAALCR